MSNYTNDHEQAAAEEGKETDEVLWALRAAGEEEEEEERKHEERKNQILLAVDHICRPRCLSSMPVSDFSVLID